jgi:hypothetical protein
MWYHARRSTALFLLALTAACGVDTVDLDDGSSRGIVYGTVEGSESTDLWVTTAGQPAMCTGGGAWLDGVPTVFVEQGTFRLRFSGFLMPPGAYCFDLMIGDATGPFDTLTGLGPVQLYPPSAPIRDSLLLTIRVDGTDAALIDSATVPPPQTSPIP